MQLNELIFVIVILLVVVIYTTRSSPSAGPESGGHHALMHHSFVGLQAKLDDGPEIMPFARFAAAPLPSKQNNWIEAVPVVDQGPWGSCTAFAMRYAYMLWYHRNNGTLPPEPSVAYWYAQSRIRLLGRAALSDMGSTTAATVWVLANLGTPTNTTWPYTAANVFIRPTLSTLTMTKISVPQAVTTFKNPVNTLEVLKLVLADNKTLLASIMVYSSMMTTKVFVTGVVPMPNLGRESLQGGHAIAITGYDDATQRFMFRNSWGSYDGINGEYTIPYNYITNPRLASSFYSF